MADCIITRRGGGGASSGAAALGVTYPQGNTCTCVDEAHSRTFTAIDTSGSCLFVLPAAGKWTASITDGSRIKSKELNLRQHEATSITLTYIQSVDISTTSLKKLGYKWSGSGQESNTAIESSANGTIVRSQGGQTSDYVMTVTPYDCSGYTTLVCDWEFEGGSAVELGGSNDTLCLFSSDEAKSGTIIKQQPFLDTVTYSSCTGTTSIDISDLSTVAYIGLKYYNSPLRDFRIVLKSIRLE